MTTRWRRALGVSLVATVLVASACGDDDDDGTTATTGAQPAATTAAAPVSTVAATEPTATTAAVDATTAASEPGTTAAPAEGFTIGYVVAGDRNDRGFYQGQVEAVEAATDELGLDLIVVDKVNPGAAQEAFENLARQGPDLIIAGGSELTDGFIPVSQSPEFADDITFLLVAGFPPDQDSYATVGANENEAHFMGGVAAALLLERTGGNRACVVAGPDLPFVRNMEENMKAGLAYQAPDKEMSVTFTGDFEDAALATEALQAQINQGCEVFYPYLGGALPAAVDAANQAGIMVSATSVDLCSTGGFAMGILYNPALFLPTVIEAFSNDEIVEGEQFALYGVGDAETLGLSDPNQGVGAVICDATPEEQQVLDDVRAKIASGEIEVGAAG
jgi:basic membrane protein A and related proteins